MVTASFLVLLATLFASETAPPSQREIIALVDQLVSPNQNMVIGVTDGPLHPPGIDRAAQDRAFGAWKKLREIGLPAFPYLHARLGDKRYCFTEDGGAANVNFSVGSACYFIIDGHLQPYGPYTAGGGDPRDRPHRPDYFSHNKLEQREAFETWWKTHKNRSMREIQIEVLEWSIAREKTRPQDYSAKELQHLNEILTKLRSSDKPLPPHWPFAK